HVGPEAIRATRRAAEKERAERFGADLDLEPDALPVLLEQELCASPARVDIRLEQDRELHRALRTHAIGASDPAGTIELGVRGGQIEFEDVHPPRVRGADA